MWLQIFPDSFLMFHPSITFMPYCFFVFLSRNEIRARIFISCITIFNFRRESAISFSLLFHYTFHFVWENVGNKTLSNHQESLFLNLKVFFKKWECLSNYWTIFSKKDKIHLKLYSLTWVPPPIMKKICIPPYD